MLVNGEQSDWKPVTSGIPQGSVLDPLLFVIYINDMPEVLSTDSSVYLFADDTKASRVVDDLQDSIMMQADLDALMEWSNLWLLKFKIDKCSILSLGSRGISFDYTMGSGDN